MLQELKAKKNKGLYDSNVERILQKNYAASSWRLGKWDDDLDELNGDKLFSISNENNKTNGAYGNNERLYDFDSSVNSILTNLSKLIKFDFISGYQSYSGNVDTMQIKKMINKDIDAARLMIVTNTEDLNGTNQVDEMNTKLHLLADIEITKKSTWTVESQGYNGFAKHLRSKRANLVSSLTIIDHVNEKISAGRSPNPKLRTNWCVTIT
ncbi:hypothetical protein AX774_g601 [Zancudomyces culisetae]|uniref:Uncharacterized protein n=1 Tax=Zancudomyces culisetae TaxID=1213189 RepID=A0A1R1PY32_ZANCU|nr:hypothetical protein AX774_g601 [Zancudomyces culisetae]|eukprot:OMH85842.1 hypothetical protein AX774_g601 [Zancudomyces culisetae]